MKGSPQPVAWPASNLLVRGLDVSRWRHLIILILLSCAALSSGFPATAETPPPPASVDTVIVHAKIYTLNPRQPWVEALAIRRGKILAVGSEQEIARYRRSAATVIDAKGHLVLPGLVDCHIHFLEGSLSLTGVNLQGAATVAEIQERLQEFAATHPGRGWVLGRGWVYSVFGAEALPHKKYLDAVLPDRPVFLEGYDGHTYWANSKALALAGITRDTPDPPNGKIVRDPQTGDPTGALKEEARVLVERMVPKPTRPQKLKALLRGLREANQAGLVRVHSAGGDFDALDLYQELRRQGRLTVRMYVAFFLDPPALTPAALEKIESARRRYHDDWLDAGVVKVMLDGVVESHTAAMLFPYADDPGQSGKLFWGEARYKQAVKELDRRGLQIFTHAIGEGAVRLALDGYAEARETNKTTDARHRIEHIETITAADVPRFGRLGVIASFQPLHAYPDENTLSVWARNVGREREPRAFAWQSVASAGGRLAFGSDWPVVTLNPWPGIQNAVTRQDQQGNPPGGWVPEQRVGLGQAIEAYTLGAAIAGRRETREGSLEAGKFADLIILSQNIFETDPRAIGQTEVLLTMVGGTRVYQSPAWSPKSRARRREGKR